MTNEPKVPLVIYHRNCADGFTAAWVIWKVHPDWEFYAGKYGEAPPDVTERDVFMVDFSYKLPVIKEMAKTAKSITIIDHHKTAQNDLLSLTVAPEVGECHIDCYFDMNHSGARLTWDYFHKQEAPPRLVQYVEDADLWKFERAGSSFISKFIFSHAYDFELWDLLAEKLENHLHTSIQEGMAISRKHFKDIDELSQFSFFKFIGGYRVPCVNVPYTMASDMCHKLCKGHPFAASYYYDGAREKFVYSLRSDEDGIDVSEIAKGMGGGGHKHAAGYEVKLEVN